MNKISIIAIDRAEAELARASKKFAETHNVEVEAYMLISEDFKKSPAYHGNETDGYFKELVCDFDDTEKLLKILSQICPGRTIFHCRMEGAMKDYAQVIELSKKPFVQTPEALFKATRKIEMRKCMSASFPEICPKFLQLDNPEQYKEELVTDFSFPVIVKPNGLHSSLLVTKCQSLSELKASVANTFEELNHVYVREHGTGEPSVLIEEFMQGDMYSVDAYSDEHGKITYLPPVAVVTANALGLNGFYCYNTELPANLNRSEIEAANTCVEKAIIATGLKSSVAHVELYNTSAGWKIIEIGPRMGGFRQSLYREAYGIDHFYNDLLLHNGEEPEISTDLKKYAIAICDYAGDEGKIVSIDGLDEVKKLESFVSFHQVLTVGDYARSASNGGQYAYDGILANKDHGKLEADTKKARELIKFNVQS